MRTPLRAALRVLNVSAILVATLGATFSMGGCRAPVQRRPMELVAEGPEPVRLRAEYREAYYFVGPTHTTVYLSEIPIAELAAGGDLTGQILHIEVLWLPKPGRTPIDSTATNATIRQIVLVEGEIGIYGGAGFVWLHGGGGGSRSRMTVRDASIALLESTDGFIDRFTPANLRGTFTARRNETQTLRVRQAISQIVTDVFQESRFVDAQPLDDGSLVAFLAPLIGRIDSDRAESIDPETVDASGSRSSEARKR